jgi:hypothetical protein
VDPGGGSGWDEPPLDVQIPDDARELDRDVIAYHRELRALRRRRRLRRLTAPFSGPGTVMPLLASILAVCLVAGAMLSVATFSPAPGHERSGRPSATAASGLASAAQRSSAQTSTTRSKQNSSSAAATTAISATASPSAGVREAARPSGSANSPARSTAPASATRLRPPGGP